ncbi:hypothetical protein LMG19083_01371 [Ralstonia psammae]|uniref:Pectate lyase n=1 Tax=Ralstonia psammae TaxID=3058598 RepID=A0ABM9J8S6_9RALS|nr:pectate lyase [Ralstonia sp. LMG 19083]CAJ0786012.1 hypothetical protein LMG19083_01371 [Ralstonia sp. LMG 19083]
MPVQIDSPQHHHVTRQPSWSEASAQQPDSSSFNHAVQNALRLLESVLRDLQARLSTGGGTSGSQSVPSVGRTQHGGHAAHADPAGSTPAVSAHNAVSGTSSVSGGGAVSYGAQPPASNGVVDVSKPIYVPAGQTFDGGGKYFRPTKALGDGSQNEHQQPVFILGQGATLKNVQYSGADGIHLLGNATLDHVVNRKVGEDAVTIDGAKNRAHDAKLAGIDPNSIPGGPAQVKILESAFYGGKDKIVQDNGDADVQMKGDYVNGAGKVFRTNGGQPLNTHLSIADSTFTNVKEAIFRTDSSTSTAAFSNVNSTNTPTDALAPNKNQVSGTNSVGYKPYTG